MPTLPQRRLPRVQLSVPLIGLGAAPLAGLFTPVPEEQAQATLHHAFARGVRFIDTSPFYGLGLSEQRVGQALAQLPREQIVLSTKAGHIPYQGGATFDYSRDGILGSVEASKQRLGVDHFDILHVHDVSQDTLSVALKEALPTVAELRAAGVVRAVGAGLNDTDILEAFIQEADLDCAILAGRYTLLEQGSLAALSEAQERGVAIFLGGVYNSGILATGAIAGAKHNYADAPAEILERTARLEAVCARYDIPLRAAAIQFALAHPAVTALIMGCRSIDEVDDVLTMYKLPIPPELWRDLVSQRLIDEAAPLPR